MKKRRLSMILALMVLISAIAPGAALAEEYAPEEAEVAEAAAVETEETTKAEMDAVEAEETTEAEMDTVEAEADATAAEETAVEDPDGAFGGEDTADEAKPAVTPSEEGSMEEAGEASVDETTAEQPTPVEDSEPEDKSAELQDFIPEYDQDDGAFHVVISGGGMGPILNPYYLPYQTGEGKYTRDGLIFPDPVLLRNDGMSDIFVTVTMWVSVPEGSRVEPVSSRSDLEVPGHRLFSWVEFQQANGKRPVWSGKYTGAYNQAVHGETVSRAVLIPAGGAAYAKFFGEFGYPEFDAWLAQDTADFYLSFSYQFVDNFPVSTAPVEEQAPADPVPAVAQAEESHAPEADTAPEVVTDSEPAMEIPAVEAPAEETPAEEPPVEDSTEPPVEASTEPPVEDSAEVPVEDSGEPPVEDSAEPPVEDSVEPSVEDSVEPPVEDSGEPPVEDSGEPPVEDSGEPPVEDSAEPPVEDSTEPPVEDSTEPPVEDSAEVPVEDSAEPPVEDSVEPPIVDTPEETPIASGIEEEAAEMETAPAPEGVEAGPETDAEDPAGSLPVTDAEGILDSIPEGGL